MIDLENLIINPAARRFFLLKMSFLKSLLGFQRSAESCPYPVNRAVQEIFRPQSFSQAVERAFGSVQYGRSAVTALQECLSDTNGLIFLYGSFVTGVCGSPKKPHYGRPFDESRISDLDLGLIDNILFNFLPNYEIIKKAQVVGNLAGRMSYSLFREGLIPKDVLNKREFSRLRSVLLEILEQTGKPIDINIYQDRSVLADGRLTSGIVLADYNKQYF